MSIKIDFVRGRSFDRLRTVYPDASQGGVRNAFMTLNVRQEAIPGGAGNLLLETGFPPLRE